MNPVFWFVGWIVLMAVTWRLGEATFYPSGYYARRPWVSFLVAAACLIGLSLAMDANQLPLSPSPTKEGQHR